MPVSSRPLHETGVPEPTDPARPRFTFAPHMLLRVERDALGDATYRYR